VTYRQVVGQAWAANLASIRWQRDASVTNTAVGVCCTVEARGACGTAATCSQTVAAAASQEQACVSHSAISAGTSCSSCQLLLVRCRAQGWVLNRKPSNPTHHACAKSCLLVDPPAALPQGLYAVLQVVALRQVPDTEPSAAAAATPLLSFSYCALLPNTVGPGMQVRPEPQVPDTNPSLFLPRQQRPPSVPQACSSGSGSKGETQKQWSGVSATVQQL
jgi:hypothetical protein